MAAGVPLKAAEEYMAALQWTRSSRQYKRIASACLAAHRPEKAAAFKKQKKAALKALKAAKGMNHRPVHAKRDR